MNNEQKKEFAELLEMTEEELEVFLKEIDPYQDSSQYEIVSGEPVTS